VGKRIAQHKPLHHLEHRGGRRGVAWIIRQGFVQIGFGTIEAGHGIAEGSREIGQRLRAAETGENEVSGSVIAHRHGRGAEFADSHAVATGVIFGEGRVSDEIACGEGHAAVEPLFAIIDPLEHGRSSQKLEGAAHRKALIGTIADKAADAGARVQNSDAEPAVARHFQRGKIVAQRVERVRRSKRASTREGQRASDRAGANRQCHAPRRIHGLPVVLQNIPMRSLAMVPVSNSAPNAITTTAAPTSTPRNNTVP
jgi:hypothetical protein